MSLMRVFFIQVMIMFMIDGISESVGLCSDSDTTNGHSLFLITFGSCPNAYSSETPSSFNFSTDHQQVFEPSVSPGQFCIVNAIPRLDYVIPIIGTVISVWHAGTLDHTENDSGGYMYLVDVGASDSQLFKLTVNNLCIGLSYDFSAYLANVLKKKVPLSVKPNIRFEVRTATVENRLLAQLNTGEIPEYDEMTWSKYGLSFEASSSSVVLLMISNAEGFLAELRGNDIAIDDIELRVCSANRSGYCPPGATTTLQPTSATCLETTTTATTTLSTSISSTNISTTLIETDPSSTTTSITTTSITTTSITTTPQTTTPKSTIYFVPRYCNDSGFGPDCNISSNLCDTLNPCKNGGICNGTHHNYNCSCLSGFIGTRCELDRRPCQRHTCLNNGTCNETLDTGFSCTCDEGWQGLHCESMINFCDTNPCMNRGVCRPLLLNYTCECLGDSYSGRHCEKTARKIIIYKIVSKSFGYVAIIALTSAAMFIIIMDILKYCFGIDPVHTERERIRRRKQAKKPKRPVIQRFIYVNAPSTTSAAPLSTIEETTET